MSENNTRRRRPGTGFILAVVAVLTITAVVTAAVISRQNRSEAGGAGAPSAEEAVRAYLDALARGDANAAVRLSRTAPPDRTFLTDDILRRQVSELPITNIEVTGNGNRVDVSADLGGERSSATVIVDKPGRGDDWKIRNASKTVDLTQPSKSINAALLRYVTLFGTPIPDGRAEVFPGWLDVGSGNPNLDVALRDSQHPELAEFFIPHTTDKLAITISEQGQEAIRSQIKEMFEDCAESTLLSPPGCPQGRPRPDLIDGTARWTAPVNYDYVETMNLDTASGNALLLGEARFTLQADSRVRGLGRIEDQVAVSIRGKVDMTQIPPKIALSN